MTVGTNRLTCGSNWQCTADAIGYAVMIKARLDSLPCPHFHGLGPPRPGGSRGSPAGTSNELDVQNAISSVFVVLILDKMLVFFTLSDFVLAINMISVRAVTLQSQTIHVERNFQKHVFQQIEVRCGCRFSLKIVF